MKTIATILLLSTFNILATPPLPPMPPGFVPAAAVTNTVTIDGPFTNTDDNVSFYIIGAMQFASNTLHIQQAGEPTFNGPVDMAIYDCYPLQQPVGAIANANFFPMNFFRSLNIPCDPGAPALAARAAAPLDSSLTPQQAAWRKTIKDKTYKLGPQLPSRINNGVKLYKLVLTEPAKASTATPPAPPMTTLGLRCPKCGKANQRLDSVDIIRDVVMDGNVKAPRGVMLKFNWKCPACATKFRTLETLK